MYERPINPPEPALWDIAVDIEGRTTATLPEIIYAIGGEAHWVNEEAGEFEASTVVEDCADCDVAEEIALHDLVGALGSRIDVDDILIEATSPEADEPDWDSYAEDILLGDW